MYGVVALIVKADDLGVRLVQRNGFLSGPLGRALVYGMPPFLETLSLIGMVAMLWVGGGILVHGLAAFGVDGARALIHDVAEAVRAAVPVAGDVLAWLVSATGAAIVGLIAGAVTAAVVAVVGAPFRKAKAGRTEPRRVAAVAADASGSIAAGRVDGGGVALGRALALAATRPAPRCTRRRTRRTVFGDRLQRRLAQHRLAGAGVSERSCTLRPTPTSKRKVQLSPFGRSSTVTMLSLREICSTANASPSPLPNVTTCCGIDGERVIRVRDDRQRASKCETCNTQGDERRACHDR